LKESCEGGSLGKGTLVGYKGAIRRYFVFMKRTENMRGMPQWPPGVHQVSLYLHYLWKEKRSLSAMKQAKNALNWALKIEGGGEIDHPIIGVMFRAAALELYKRTNKKHALSPEQVRKYVRHCRERRGGGKEGYEELALIALIQFQGHRRIGEIIGGGRSERMVPRRNVRFVEGGMTLLHRGKTQGMREGELCFYPYLERREFCAVTHLRAYLEKQGRLRLGRDSPEWDKPLFQRRGEEIKYDWLLKEMKRAFDSIGVDSRFIGTHSIHTVVRTQYNV
jgi:hypothetical protein